MQNAFVESFIGRLRDECLNETLFSSLDQARRHLARWRADYNQVRPHSALGNRTPAAFAATAAPALEPWMGSTPPLNAKRHLAEWQIQGSNHNPGTLQMIG